MAKRADEPAEALARLDDLLQHRARLGICVLLAGADALSFSRLKELLNETDGNLGAHLRKLNEAGYVSVRKEFVDRHGKVLKGTAVGIFKPVSWYTLTATGRVRLEQHLAGLDQLIRQMGGK